MSIFSDDKDPIQIDCLLHILAAAVCSTGAGIAGITMKYSVFADNTTAGITQPPWYQSNTVNDPLAIDDLFRNIALGEIVMVSRL